MQSLEIPSDPDRGMSLEALTLALDRWPAMSWDARMQAALAMLGRLAVQR